MAFGSNAFPLGPNGQFPKQRIAKFNNSIIPASQVEDVYRRNTRSQLPVVEYDFNSSLNKVKRSMKQGRVMRAGQDENKFTPRSLKRKNRLTETNVLSHGPQWKIDHLEERPDGGLSGLGWIKDSIIGLITPAKKVRRMGVTIFNGKA
jgi:hypothetical protein